MIVKVPFYYKDFKCIAGDCPDSCCQGWEVDADENSLNYYKTLTGDIKNKIDSVLDNDEFGNSVFKLVKDKRCPFLNSDNLCDMHIAIGAEHTPLTCRMFPRFINDFGGTREMGISFSCPVASDIIFNLDERFSLISEVNDEPPQLNDIDASTYFCLLKAREKAFSIIEDESDDMKNKLIKLLDYGVELQEQLGGYTQGGDNIEFFDVFRNPELINNQWLEKLDNAKIKAVSNSRFNRNIASYFIYRYFLDAVYDSDVLSKIKTAVIGVLIVTYLGEDSWTIHLWSKETEHSQYNMDRYKKFLVTADCLTTDSLKEKLNY